VPIVIVMTDVDQHNSPTCACNYLTTVPSGGPAYATTITSLATLNARVVGIATSTGANAFLNRLILDSTIARGAPGASGGRGRLELREMTVASGEDPSAARVVATLDYEREGDDRLRLSGDFAGARLDARLERMRPGDTLLMTRGFHWVNETPFNR
jgi:hypothetical protein